MTRTLQAKLLVLAVFLVGMLAGVVLTNAYETNVQGNGVLDTESRADGDSDRGRGRNRERQSFEEYLGLSPDQNEQMSAILKGASEGYRELQARTRPEYRSLRADSREKIRAMLNDDQRALYENWLERERERDGKRRRGGRGGMHD
jgi:uncharacterized membrane protein